MAYYEDKELVEIVAEAMYVSWQKGSSIGQPVWPYATVTAQDYWRERAAAALDPTPDPDKYDELRRQLTNCYPAVGADFITQVINLMRKANEDIK